MLQQAFGIVSALLVVCVAVPYYMSIFRGRSHPQRTAMFIFLVLSLISFSSQWAEGATASLWFAGFLVINQLCIFALSLKFGSGGYRKIDVFSLLTAAGIMILWYFSKNAGLAVVLVTAVNFVGKALVFHKVQHRPQSELLYSWALSVVASLFAIASVGSLQFTLILPPLHNAVTVGAIAYIMYQKGNRSFSPFH